MSNDRQGPKLELLLVQERRETVQEMTERVARENETRRQLANLDMWLENSCDCNRGEYD